MFKYILAVAGYFLLGGSFIAGFLGYFIGSSIDRARDYGVGGMNPLANGHRKEVFLETTFALMGKLAKADGVISKDEINHVEDFIKKMGMETAHRTIAIDQFKRGSADDFNIDTALDQFMSVCGSTLNLKQTLIMYLIVLALADGKIDKSEQDMLEHISIRLGYSRAEFTHMMEMILNQSHFSSGQSGRARPSSASALSDAYKALGVKKENTDQEIKRAYRKLMSQNHPDKLMGQGLPDDMIAVATEKTKEIQVAYDLIKKQRPKA